MIGEEQIEFEPNEEESAMKLEKAPVELIPALNNDGTGEVAYIELLPDEMLYHILSFFTLREAIQTSILASKWRLFCTSLPNLNFDGLNLIKQPEMQCCLLDKHWIVKIVDQSLNNYLGTRILTFRFSFCLPKEYACQIDRWITFAVRLGVENLTLQLSCYSVYLHHVRFKLPEYKYKEYYVFPCHLLPQCNESKLNQLFLQTCILGPCLNDQFRSLKTLELLDVHLVQSDVDRVFSSCLNLEFLFLERCYLLGTLRLGVLQRLKSLMVFRCSELKGIELSAAHLTTFEYTGNPINFSHLTIPSLRKLDCWADCDRSLGYIFSQLGNAHPHVEFLSIFTATNWVKQIPEWLTTICKVKQLELHFYEETEFHIPKMFAILIACPLLQKFHVVTQSYYVKTFEDFTLGGRKHKHMKEVVYRGFRGTKSEVAFVMKLVKYAAMLEQMIIVTRPVFPQGGRFVKMGLNMCPQVNSGRMVKILQKKATSKKVAITCFW